MSAARVTFRTSPATSKHEPEEITGTAAAHLGVPVVVHSHPWPNGRGKSWCVSEPVTGRSISTGSDSPRAALALAAERVALVGGLCALLHNMAHAGALDGVSASTTGGARPSGARLHSAELAYLAGGPLDAPDRLPAGAHACRYYGTREAVTVPRPGWLR